MRFHLRRIAPVLRHNDVVWQNILVVQWIEGVCPQEHSLGKQSLPPPNATPQMRFLKCTNEWFKTLNSSKSHVFAPSYIP